MKEIFLAIKNFLRESFSLKEDKAEEQEIVDNIKKDVSFRGTNLWTLVFAILIASIGLNVNSTAVIIGAMLISPLMGPIMGVGLAVATNDLDLLKRGVKNLAIAVIISIITSTVYFYITPLHNVNSELLARVNPSLWDVFIAFFGGLAGIVAGTRTKKSTVIPGVAIATALMPPLCTAGFGIATGQLMYTVGAAYLFFINSMFICFATFLVVRKLHFHKHEFQTQSGEKKVIRLIWTVVLITLLPSIFLAYRIVKRAIFESSAKNYVQQEFRFPRTQVINRNYKMAGTKTTIELLVVGEELRPATIYSLAERMTLYGLDSTKLIVHQGLDAKQEIDLAQIKASILEDVFMKEKQNETISLQHHKIDLPIPDLQLELNSLYPNLRNYSLAQTVQFNFDLSRRDTFTLFSGSFKGNFSKSEQVKLQSWLKQRIKSDSVKIYLE